MEDNEDIIYNRKPKTQKVVNPKNTIKTNITSKSQSLLQKQSNNQKQSNGQNLTNQVSNLSTQALEPNVGDIMFTREENNILLTWTAPKDFKVNGYKVYRSPQVLSEPSSINADNLVGTTVPPATIYTDRLQGFGTYYYAVTVTGTNGMEHPSLVAGQSYTTNPMKAEIEKTKKSVTSLKVLNSSNGHVQICWDGLQIPGATYNIYRNPSPLTNGVTLPLPIGNVSSNCFSDVLDIGGSYFYAVTSVLDGKEDISLVTNQNSLSQPVIWNPGEIIPMNVTNEKIVRPKPVKAIKLKSIGTYEQELLSLLRDYYYTQDYAHALKKLDLYMKDKNCPETFRNQARLFYAKTLFFLGRYKEAVDLFIQLIPLYPEEAGFWLTKSLDKL